MDASRVIKETEVLEVWHLVASRHSTGDLQLSLLTRALICAAKTLKVPKFVVVRELERAWDETNVLVRKVG